MPDAVVRGKAVAPAGRPFAPVKEDQVTPVLMLVLMVEELA